MRTMHAATCAVMSTFALVAACGASPEDLEDPDDPSFAPEVGEPSVDDPIVPLPESVRLDKRKVRLGERLFRDPILSRDRDTSCLVCHPFERGGTDGLAKSQLFGKEPLSVNTPTIFNVGLSYKLHWEGAWDSLEAQLDTPIKSPKVMNNTYEEIVTRLRADAGYRSAFEEIYRDGVTERNFREVLAVYERSLLTPRSRFDRFLAGEVGAISDEEHRGYSLFKSHGCISCHQGVNVGGNMMQKFGALKDYFEGRSFADADLGLYLVTKREEDKHVFRVPSLRNVALTAPYFHDGSAQTLDKAVRVMSEYQLGRTLTDEQARLIVAFLGTLTGEIPGGSP